MSMNKDHIETLYESRFLRCYDLQYAEGKHYYAASRREKEDLVAKMTDEEFRGMLPDAVTVVVVLHLPGEETRLLMSYEYRYPVGQYLLSPVAGLLDPEDRESADPLVSAAITDESNAFLCAEITLEDLGELNQRGAVGAEQFDGFELLDRERARNIFRSGRDEHGNFYSLAAWMVLSIFLSMF